jgi:uncharacterized protein with PhoU and TrkA domain
MLNKMKSTILYSKVESAVWNAERKVKDTTKSTVKAVKNPENVKKVAKTACAVATVTNAANAGVAVGTMVATGVTQNAATAAAVHSVKAMLYRNMHKCISEADTTKKEK